MKKLLFMLLCCTFFILGCSNNQEDEIFEFDEDIDNLEVENDHVSLGDGYANDEVRKLAELARKTYDEGKLEDALELYNKAVDMDKNNAELYADRARVKRDLGNGEAAIEDMNKALSLRQEDWFYGERGIAYRSIGNNAAALEDFNKALSMNPDLEWVKKEIENTK